jgi:hypothetical protein
VSGPWNAPSREAATIDRSQTMADLRIEDRPSAIAADQVTPIGRPTGTILGPLLRPVAMPDGTHQLGAGAEALVGSSASASSTRSTVRCRGTPWMFVWRRPGSSETAFSRSRPFLGLTIGIALGRSLRPLFNLRPQCGGSPRNSALASANGERYPLSRPPRLLVLPPAMVDLACPRKRIRRRSRADDR